MIGVYGGTFDPIHYGHLRPALDVLQSLKLTEVRFIPCGQPGHRSNPVATAKQRLSMVCSAIEGESCFRLDDREISHTNPCYTIDTLLSLRKELIDVPICLIVGIDAFMQFDSWHRWNEILDLVHLVITQRPGWQIPTTKGTTILSKSIKKLIKEHCIDDPKMLHGNKSGKILFQNVTQIDISSTKIRGLIQQGNSMRYLLPESVAEIIHKQKIYEKKI